MDYMKHIIRKFLQSTKLSTEVLDVLASAKSDKNYVETINEVGVDEYTGWAQTTEGFLIQMFSYQGKDAGYFIPEPHPVVLYFHGAQNYLSHVKEGREKLFAQLNATPATPQKILDAFYAHFGHITLYTTFLYNALEAFINFSIPEGYEHRRVRTDKTELLSKEQIQRHSTFQEKIKEVIPGATGKKFHQDYASKYETLLKLKECRDEIIHTKTYGNIQSNPYKKLFVMALDFDYLAAIWAVRDYINYYEPNLIEDCNCGKEH